MCKNESIIKNIVYNVSAPCFFNYVNWILDECVKRNINKIYFLARDGFVLQKIAKKICKKNKLNIDCRYLYCSRHSLRLPIYNLLDEEKFEMIFSSSFFISLKSILKRVDFSDNLIKKLSKQISFEDVNKELNKQEFEILEEKLKNNKTFIEELNKKSKQAYDITIDYLKQEKVFDDNKFVLVDSGWLGSMQRSFRIIFDSQKFKPEIIGFYFGLYYKTNTEDGKFLSYYFSNKAGFRQKLNFNQSVFECLLSANHPMTLSYEREGKKIVPVYAEKFVKNDDFIKKQIKYILAFADEKIDKGYVFNFKNSIKSDYKNLKRFMTKPTIKEVNLFKNFYFCDDVSESYAKPIAGAEKLTDLKSYEFFNRVISKLFKLKKAKFLKIFWPYSAIVDIKPKIKKTWYFLNFKLMDFFILLLKKK